MEFTEFDLERINGGLGTDYDFDIIVERLFGREYANYQKGLYDRVYTVEQVSDILLYSDFELTPENLLVVTNKLNEKIAREKAKLNMELDEEQLENVHGGNPSDSQNIAFMLYNKMLMNGINVTIVNSEYVISELSSMGINVEEEEAKKISDTINSLLEHDSKLKSGR